MFVVGIYPILGYWMSYFHKVLMIKKIKELLPQLVHNGFKVHLNSLLKTVVIFTFFLNFNVGIFKTFSTVNVSGGNVTEYLVFFSRFREDVGAYVFYTYCVLNWSHHFYSHQTEAVYLGCMNDLMNK